MKLALALAALTSVAGCAHRSCPGPAGAWASSGLRVGVEGRAAATPDEARIALGVFTEAATAGEATDENARRQASILAAVKPLLPAGGQVQTQTYNLYPVTVEGKPTRYQVRNVVEIRLPDLKLVGRVIDTAVQNGGNEVQSLSFGLRDPSPARKLALADAAQRARAEGEALAASLGLRIVGVRAIENEAPQPVQPLRPMMAMAKMADSAPTPIEAGQLEVTAQITVTFDVAPR